jgi:hypothetical protein
VVSSQVVDQEGAEPRLVPNLFKWSSDGSFVAHMATAEVDDKFGANSLIKVRCHWLALLLPAVVAVALAA